MYQLETFFVMFSAPKRRCQYSRGLHKSLTLLRSQNFLHGLLVVEDKLSMAHGLESRVPFLDNDLVDFAMRCPARLKLNNLAEVARINENDLGLSKRSIFEKIGW